MDNPFDKILQELDKLNKRLDALEASLPKENSIKRYSVQELADNTPLGVQTIRARIHDGTIKAQRFGSKYLITAEEFNRVCQESRSIKYKRS